MDNPFLFLITALLVYAELSCIAMAVCLLTDRAIVYVVILIGCLAGLMFGGNLLSSSFDKNQFLFEETVADSEMVLQKNESPYYIHSPIRDFYEQILRISLLQPVNEYGDLYYNDKLSAAKISINYWKNEAENAVSEEQREQNLYMMEEIQTRMKRHTDRLSFFPYYQVGVLLIVCFGGTLLFRKRNLK